MDMWDAFIKAVKETIPDAEKKICFDRFHVAQHFNKALDKVRAQEHRAFMKEDGESPLAKTKFDWLRNAEKIDNRTRRTFMALVKTNLKTSLAWAMKETAGRLWDYTSRTWAEKAWTCLIQWMSNEMLTPMHKLANMIQKNLWGMLNAITHKTTNALSESLNAGIQRIKKMACGYRNRYRFRDAILFHFGGLDMEPRGT